MLDHLRMLVLNIPYLTDVVIEIVELDRWQAITLLAGTRKTPTS